MKRFLNKKLIILGVLLILLISGIAIYLSTKETRDIIVEPIPTLDPEHMDKDIRNHWLENKAKNVDYVGEV